MQMDESKRLENKLNVDIANEWNGISALRFKQLSEKKDFSYEYILKPHILSEIKRHSKINVIDIGCGTGNLTNEVSEYCDKLLGLDISQESITIAKRFIKENVTYLTNDITTFSRNYSSEKFTLAISNMSIMDMNDLESTISSINRILVDDGIFIFTITHPFFWPKYKGYEDEEWFSYKKEHIIESNFDIANEKSRYKTTHIHRPIETYINTLIKEGFILENFIELMPDNQYLNKFNSIQEYPRFLSITVRKS